MPSLLHVILPEASGVHVDVAQRGAQALGRHVWALVSIMVVGMKVQLPHLSHLKTMTMVMAERSRNLHQLVWQVPRTSDL